MNDPNAKVRRLQISTELLFDLFRAGAHAGGYTVTQDGIPEDAELVNVQHAWPNTVELLIRSETFEPVPLVGQEIPCIRPLVTKDVA